MRRPTRHPRPNDFVTAIDSEPLFERYGHVDAAKTCFTFAKWLDDQRHFGGAWHTSTDFWPDDSLHPAVEDLMGAGMLISEIKAISTHIALGIDAAVALASYRSFAEQLVELAKSSASGRELIDAEFADDVNIACELNESRSVAIFRAWRIPRPCQN